MGRDLVIRYVNPFDQSMPFLVAVHVKDWTDVVHVGVTKQLLEIVENANWHMEARLIGNAQCQVFIYAFPSASATQR
jgi:hypothetical protein